MNVIETSHVTKTYRVGVGRARVREMLPSPIDVAVKRLLPRWWMKDTFNALDDVDIQIPGGASTGIVGHNGAGKTTLLKVIAGVTSPTSGRLTVRGRIAALIDLLVGFNPDLTGRENAYLLGAMHGFGRKAMNGRIEGIFDFAGIDNMANTPVKRYSAGMSARLGFAVISALNTEVLLIDEVLAVGDAAYQQKCIRWLDGYRERGGTLLFVSHNLSLVRHMTDRVVWMDHGEVKGDGPTSSVLLDYAQSLERRGSAGPMRRGTNVRKLLVGEGATRWGVGGARIDQVHVGGPGGNGEGLTIAITYEASALEEAVFCVGFVDEAGHEIGAASSPAVSLKEQGGEINCAIRPVPLRAGIYFPVVGIITQDGRVHDRWKLDRAVVVEANGDTMLAHDFGPVTIPASWSP